MKYLLIVILFTSIEVFGAQIKCGKQAPEWRSCKTSTDCTLISNSCRDKWEMVNRKFIGQAKNYFSCMKRKENCNSNPKPEVNSGIVPKCEAYGIFGRENEKPSCMDLKDIVSMAVNNNDRIRLMKAFEDSKNVDMSLSHIDETPLTLAALNAKTELVRWLISRGAKVNFQTKNGYTALMFAASSPNNDKKAVNQTVAILMKAGSDKELANSRGENALALAKLAKNYGSIKLLK